MDISFYFVMINQILKFYCLNIITACTEEGRTATGGREKGDDFGKSFFKLSVYGSLSVSADTGWKGGGEMLGWEFIFGCLRAQRRPNLRWKSQRIKIQMLASGFFKDFSNPRASLLVSFPKSWISFCYSQTFDRLMAGRLFFFI
jgi:hypothetical protein